MLGGATDTTGKRMDQPKIPFLLARSLPRCLLEFEGVIVDVELVLTLAFAPDGVGFTCDGVIGAWLLVLMGVDICVKGM